MYLGWIGVYQKTERESGEAVVLSTPTVKQTKIFLEVVAVVGSRWVTQATGQHEIETVIGRDTIDRNLAEPGHVYRRE